MRASADFVRSDLGGLVTHRVKRVGDPEEFAEQMSLYSPGVRIDAVSPGTFSGLSRAARTARLSLFSTEIANARVRLLSPGDYVSVSMPLDGHLQFVEDDKSSLVGVNEAYILRPDSELDILHPEIRRVLVLNMSRGLVEKTLRDLAGDPEADIDDIDRILSLKGREGASFSRLASFYWSEFIRSSPLWRVGQVSDHAENALVCAFVLALVAGTKVENSEQGNMTRSLVNLARDFIHNHPDRPLTLAEIAENAGVSARTLTRAFQAEFGVGPVGYHRRHRLERAHLALAAGNSAEVTVTDVAMKYGFYQLSHFAAAYKAMFGETPSETLHT